MSTVHQQVLDIFFEKLVQHEEISQAQIDALRELMQQDTKLKAKDVECIFMPGEDAVQ